MLESKSVRPNNAILPGQRFGSLVVIRRAPERKCGAWFVRCDCGTETYVRASKLRNGQTHSCGCRKFKLVSAGKLTVVERFWLRVERSDNCWLWTGPKNRHGYGDFSKSYGKKVLAHRMSYELTNEPIPEGLYVLHRCDNRRCVRPDHLFLGTHADNMADMVAKGRGVRGEKSSSARLSVEQVREIRKRSAAGESLNSLSRAFGVSDSQIHNIVRRKAWRDVA